MTELTREEWGVVAETLGIMADTTEKQASALEEMLAKEFPEMRHQEAIVKMEELRITKEIGKHLRMAIAAILWVSENAAERIRFEMLDGHPPDGNCRQIRERGAH